MFISNEMLSSNDIFLRSFDHYMKPEKRRCIQAVRKTKLISFFALYSIRYSILCNIITGSVQYSVYCIQRKRVINIYVCAYTVFSLCVLVHRTLFELYDAFKSSAPARMIVKITTSSLTFYGLLPGTIFITYTDRSTVSMNR